MKKQIFAAILVLFILIVSQLVWLNQAWKLDKERLHNELKVELNNIISYQSLFTSSEKDKDSNNVSSFTMIETESKNDTISKDIVITNDYDSEKNIGQLVENAFMNFALETNKISVASIDSLFRKSYPGINELRYYHFKLLKKGQTTDSIRYGKESFIPAFVIDIPLGSKNEYYFTADFVLQPSMQIRNMLFSIGITAVAVILVAIFIFFQLIQLQQRTLLLQEREKAVNGIVHDLKSPLAYIYTMLGIFEKTETDSRRQHNLNTAKTRVKFLSEKIEALLSAFKIKNDRINLQPCAYDIGLRCNEIMEELKLVYKDKEIGYHIQIPSGYMLQVDTVYFEGCVRNLLDNAVKYSAEKVEISVSLIQKGSRVYLYFKDNGVGIAPDLRKKVFRQFYRDTQSGEVKGHGIGLSFAKQIVKAHKGKIFIENRDIKEKGSIFVIELPVS